MFSPDDIKELRRRTGMPQLEYMTAGGGIMQVGNRVLRRSPAQPANREGKLFPVAQTGKFLAGHATRYFKAHQFRGRFEIFMRGVFAATLASDAVVRFLVEHDESRCVATTADGTLKLRSTDAGLAFSLAIPNTELGRAVLADVKSGRRRAMSVTYEPIETEVREMAGEQVTLIRSARLNEVSLVERPAVAEAFAELSEGEITAVASDAATADYQSASAKMSAAIASVSNLVEGL